MKFIFSIIGTISLAVSVNAADIEPSTPLYSLPSGTLIKVSGHFESNVQTSLSNMFFFQKGETPKPWIADKDEGHCIFSASSKSIDDLTFEVDAASKAQEGSTFAVLMQSFSGGANQDLICDSKEGDIHYPTVETLTRSFGSANTQIILPK